MSKGSNTTRNVGAATRSGQSNSTKTTFELGEGDILDRNGISRIVEAVMQGKSVETSGETGHDYIIKKEDNGDITFTPKNKTDKDLIGVSRISSSQSGLRIGEDFRPKNATMAEMLFNRIADLDDETSIRKYQY